MVTYRLMPAIFLFISSACAVEGQTTAGSMPRPFPLPPAWVQDQTLYEVNLREFSDSGDVNGLRARLPQLKQLGVGILWIMPVYPIGDVNRNGKLGSPYAVKDYKGFNTEYGTIENFKATVDDAHRMGMFVILDWVANHTAVDHPWVHQHDDWYKHDGKGQLIHPLPAWKDVLALNFDSAPLRQEMINSMAYWVQDVGIDGFRCDSAEFVPLQFWAQARDALRKIKPIFLLVEGVAPDLTHYGFDGSYAWHLPTNMEQIVKGTKNAKDLTNYIDADQRDLAGNGFRLNFTSNHDKNAWEGTTRELLGDGIPAFTVLTFTLPGMPLIFNGQEAGAEHRMSLFEHDPIRWRDDPMAVLYRTLSELKRNHRCLRCGGDDAPALIIRESTSASVLTFQRRLKGDSVIVMLNLSANPASVPAPDDVAAMRLAIGKKITRDQSGALLFGPWDFCVWTTDP